MITSVKNPTAYLVDTSWKQNWSKFEPLPKQPQHNESIFQKTIQSQKGFLW